MPSYYFQMYIFNVYGAVSLTVYIVLLLITGAFVNGPYALITTAVSADLGTHPSKLILFQLRNQLSNLVLCYFLVASGQTCCFSPIIKRCFGLFGC